MASQTSGLTNRSSAVIGTAEVVLVGANKGRQYLLVQNLSAVVMWVSLDDAITPTTSGAAGSIYLAANGGSIIFEGESWVPSGQVSVIAATGSNNVVTCLEG